MSDTNPSSNPYDHIIDEDEPLSQTPSQYERSGWAADDD
jgi:hypothetical protein